MYDDLTRRTHFYENPPVSREARHGGMADSGQGKHGSGRIFIGRWAARPGPAQQERGGWPLKPLRGLRELRGEKFFAKISPINSTKEQQNVTSEKHC